MRLYVVRHAQAQPDSPTGLDQDRPLTSLGVQQSAWLAERLAVASVPPAKVVLSGAVRTQQTAEPILKALGCAEEVCDQLWPGEVASRAIELIDEHAGTPSLAVVGHNPQLELLVACLVAGPTAASSRIATGQVVEIECDCPVALGCAQLVGVSRMP